MGHPLARAGDLSCDCAASERHQTEDREQDVRLDTTRKVLRASDICRSEQSVNTASERHKKEIS